MQISQEKGIKLSKVQLEIVELIKNNPRITQVDLIKRLGVAQQVVSYNLRMLERNGVINREKRGRTSRYYYTILKNKD